MKPNSSKRTVDRRANDETIAQEPGVDTNSEADFEADEMPGSLGRYKVERLLGRGGMGAVYLAHDSQLNRKVALKIPNFGENTNPKLVARFYREARSAATLSHPNLCPVFDVGEIDGTHYIAMAYIQGHPLAAFVNAEKPPSPRSVASTIRKVALAMEEAHSSGIIHRDLKPANIMIDQRNEPIVMDFGLACPEDHGEDSRLTQAGSLLGSPAYMSPEQLSGDPGSITAGTDIYALGVVMYELLTGALPFQGGGSTVRLIGRILSEEPADIQSLRPDVDEPLAVICRKAMSKNLEDRYGSMKEFAAAITNCLKSGGQSTTKMGEPSRMSAAAVSRIQLTEQSKVAKTLCESGQYAAAIPILQQIIANEAGKDTKMVQWAKAMLPKIEQKVKQEAQTTATPEQASEDLIANLPDAVTVSDQPLRPVATAGRGTPKSKASNATRNIAIAVAFCVVGIAAGAVGVYALLIDSGTSSAQSETEATNSIANKNTQTATSEAEKVNAASDQSDVPDAISSNGDLALFKELDRDDSGYVEEHEIPGRERALMMGADKDRDHRISKEEFLAEDRPPRPGFPGRPGFREGGPGFRENGQGFRDNGQGFREGGPGFREGGPASRKDGFGERGRGFREAGQGPMSGRNDDLMRFDSNGDGMIDRSEFPPSRPFPSIADTNDDGFIDRSELEQMGRRRPLRGGRNDGRLGPGGNDDGQPQP